jgi:hypothetical protein
MCPGHLVKFFELLGNVLRDDGNVLVPHLHPQVVVLIQQNLHVDVKTRVTSSRYGLSVQRELEILLKDS